MVSSLVAEIGTEVARPGPVRVVLSPDWLEAAGAGQKTLRLLDDRGTEVPYVIARQSGAEEAVRMTPMEIVDYTEGDGYEKLVLRAERDAPPLRALRFETRSRDFQRRVAVESSVDGDAWALLGEGLFFDLSSRYDFRRNRIEFAPTDTRWFRVRMDVPDTGNGRGMDVRWGDRTISLRDFPGGAVPRVDRIVGESAAAAKVPAVWYRRVFSPVEVITEGRVSFVDLGCPQVPADRIELVTATPVLSRHVRVETREAVSGADVFRSRARGRVQRTPDDPRTPLRIELASDHLECVRLVIENNDDPPLPLEAVHLEWHRREMIFIAEPDRFYTLYAGGRSLERPRYGLADVLTADPASLAAIPAADVGPPAPNPAWDGLREEPTPWTERWLPALFGALLLLLAVAMAVWIWRILRAA